MLGPSLYVSRTITTTTPPLGKLVGFMGKKYIFNNDSALTSLLTVVAVMATQAVPY